MAEPAPPADAGGDFGLPPKPQPPLPGDCCGGDCAACVFDIHERELEAWRQAVEKIRNARES